MPHIPLTLRLRRSMFYPYCNEIVIAELESATRPMPVWAFSLCNTGLQRNHQLGHTLSEMGVGSDQLNELGIEPSGPIKATGFRDAITNQTSALPTPIRFYFQRDGVVTELRALPLDPAHPATRPDYDRANGNYAWRVLAWYSRTGLMPVAGVRSEMPLPLGGLGELVLDPEYLRTHT